MSSKSYLTGEARWAREQAAKAQGSIDDLLDVRSLNRKRDQARVVAFRARADLRAALANLRDLDDEHLPETVAVHERNREHWTKLANEYEARIAQDEDQPIWEDA